MPTPWDKSLPGKVRFRNVAIIVLAVLTLLCCLCSGLYSVISSQTPEGKATATARAIPTETRTPAPTATPRPTDPPTATRPPTSTPAPTNTATPRPPTATPEPFSYSFGDGTWVVGKDIAAGTYRQRTGAGCYWQRSSGFGGTLGEILANANTVGPAIVTILPTDKGFTSTRCGRWTQDLSPVTSSPTASFSDGTYFVGKDIAPGTWRSSGTDSCYWARLSGFTGAMGQILANANVKGQAVVTIAATDAGFTATRCGTWSKIQ